MAQSLNVSARADKCGSLRKGLDVAKKPPVNSLLFLGTGPGNPVPGRGNSACLLRTSSAQILVDAGEPCSLRLREHGVALSDLDAVLLTHAHSDHTAGFFMLVQSAWLEKRSRVLPVYLPEELVLPMKTWLEAVYLPEKLIGFPLEFRPWKPNEAAKVASDVVVQTFSTTHLEGLRRLIEPETSRRFKVFGLDIHCGGRRVVFSSDLGSPQDLAPVLENPCDVLVCELSHFEPEELFGFLKGHEIGTLVLNHLSAALRGREDELLKAVKAALPGVRRTVIPCDGDVVEF